MKPKTTKSGNFRPRYSNYLDSGLFVDLGIGGDYGDVETHQTYSSDGTPLTGGSSNWSSFWNNLVSSVSSVATSIWGNNNQWQTQAYSTMYEQEKRTNTILWVVIGLVVALGVFLVIRKTK